MSQIKKTELDLIVEAIEKAAKTAKVEPIQVTKAQVLKQGTVTDWTLRKYGGLAAVKGSEFPEEHKELAKIQELRTNKNYLAKVERQLGDKENFEKSILEAIEKTLKPTKFTPYTRPKKAKIKRAVTLVLSDLHIGSDIDKKETGALDFGKIEESRRLARITKEAMEYKEQYREETELNLLLLGDIVQNSLHDPRDGAPLAEQIARGIHLLSQSIYHLARSYPKVTVYCNTGNHGRNTARHHGRATNQKWDSMETILYYALKKVFQKVENVTFNIPMTPYLTYDVFGKKIFASHGDTVFNPGYPGKSINVGNLEEQTNRINASLKDSHEYSAFIVGHVHTASITHLGNNSVMLTNGAMVPSDAYAVSIGLLENNCGQWIFESVENFPVGDCRFLRVTEKDDKNKELDKIIEPFDTL